MWVRLRCGLSLRRHLLWSMSRHSAPAVTHRSCLRAAPLNRQLGRRDFHPPIQGLFRHTIAVPPAGRQTRFQELPQLLSLLTSVAWSHHKSPLRSASRNLERSAFPTPKQGVQNPFLLWTPKGTSFTSTYRGCSATVNGICRFRHSSIRRRSSCLLAHRARAPLGPGDARMSEANGCRPARGTMA